QFRVGLFELACRPPVRELAHLRRRDRGAHAGDGRTRGLRGGAHRRTLGPLFHSLALLSFAIPGLLTAMAWIFVLSPNIGWVNALMKSWFGFSESPFSIYSMGGMIWALSS